MRSKENSLIYQSKYIDLPENPSDAEREPDTENDINRDSKEWNFGLAEYADTVGPQGKRFFLFKNILNILGLNFLLNGQTGRVRKCMWLIMMVIGSVWCVQNVRSGYF